MGSSAAEPHLPIVMSQHPCMPELRPMMRATKDASVSTVGDSMPFDETGRLEALIFRLVLDAGEALRGGPVAGQFEDPAQEHRHVREFRADPLFDLRYHPLSMPLVAVT